MRGAQLCEPKQLAAKLRAQLPGCARTIPQTTVNQGAAVLAQQNAAFFCQWPHAHKGDRQRVPWASQPTEHGMHLLRGLRGKGDFEQIRTGCNGALFQDIQLAGCWRR